MATALITGGASGLGLGTCQALQKYSDITRIVLLDRNKEAAQQAADFLHNNNNKKLEVIPIECDVCDEKDVEQVVGVAAGEASAPLRLVVNCAGISTAGRVVGKKYKMDTAVFKKVVEVNLVGTFIVTKVAVEAMRDKTPLRKQPEFVGFRNSVEGVEEEGGEGREERGVVVNVASLAAFEGQVGQVPYAASKAGVVGITLPLAREFEQHKIRIVTIAPGLVDTPMMAQAGDGAKRDLVGGVVFPKRMAGVGEFGVLVGHVYLNSYLNGEVVRLDGGLRMPYSKL